MRVRRSGGKAALHRRPADERRRQLIGAEDGAGGGHPVRDLRNQVVREFRADPVGIDFGSDACLKEGAKFGEQRLVLNRQRFAHLVEVAGP